MSKFSTENIKAVIVRLEPFASQECDRCHKTATLTHEVETYDKGLFLVCEDCGRALIKSKKKEELE